MFFNQDVLFRNGPLALIWMAGNDELRVKDMRGRRNKQYLLVLQSNIVQLCDLVRQQFPQMGTSKGMNLKKVATLVKGLGVIYISKLDNLARNLSEVNVNLQVITSARLRQIDLPSKVSKTPAAMLLANDEIAPMLGFGALEDAEDIDFGGLPRFDSPPSSPRGNPRIAAAGDYPNVVMSPRTEDSVRVDKRKKKKGKAVADNELDEERVLRLLQDTVALNQRAHCMTEANGIESIRPEINEPWDEFNPEFDIPLENNMHAESGGSNQDQPLELIHRDARLSSPPGRLSTRSDINRSRPLDDFDRMDEELPNNAEGQGLQVQIPSQELQLQSLNMTEGARVPHRGKRHSKRLRIDQEKSISLEKMREILENGKKPLDYDALFLEMAKNRGAAARSLLHGMSYLDGVGRKINGNRLSRFVDSIKKIPRRNEAIQPIQQERPEITASVNEDSNGLENPAAESRPGASDLELLPLPFGSIEDGEILDQNQINNEPQLAISFIEDPEQNNFADRIQVERQERMDSQRSQDAIPPGQTTFQAMFPPSKVSRKQAAVGFFQLLRLQSKKSVALEQDHPFGEIVIIPTPREANA